MKDRDDCKSIPANAFTAEFLNSQYEREDEPMAAIEAEGRGPWQVAEIAAEGPPAESAEAERWAVLRSWESPESAEPSGTFRTLDHALLWAAALEVAARGPVLAVGRSHDEAGQVVTEWTADSGLVPVGHTAVFDQDAVAAFRLLESLLRSPEALARVLIAAGGSIAELVGRRLAAG